MIFTFFKNEDRDLEFFAFETLKTGGLGLGFASFSLDRSILCFSSSSGSLGFCEVFLSDGKSILSFLSRLVLTLLNTPH